MFVRYCIQIFAKINTQLLKLFLNYVSKESEMFLVIYNKINYTTYELKFI